MAAVVVISVPLIVLFWCSAKDYGGRIAGRGKRMRPFWKKDAVLCDGVRLSDRAAAGLTGCHGSKGKSRV